MKEKKEYVIALEQLNEASALANLSRDQHLMIQKSVMLLNHLIEKSFSKEDVDG